MKDSPAVGLQLTFKAKLERWAEGMDYAAVAVPAKITRALQTKGPVLVMAQVNGSDPFKVSLFPVGDGQHYVRIKAKVRREAKAKIGDWLRIQINVLDRTDITYPKDLVRALREAGLTKQFKTLPPGKQNFMIRRIDEVVNPETRKRRIEQTVSALGLSK